MATMLVGCGTARQESHSPWMWPWEDTLTTTATVRGVYSTDVKGTDRFGRIQPERVLCSEPSPDVATAVSSSFGAGLTLAGTEPKSQIEAELAASIASSSAQAVAQLGERLATIQLLRDGFFRACEAYANGAITPTTYTLIVSRIDDIMVTLLATEIAGGAFGRGQAALGGSTSGAAAAAQAVGAASEKAVQLTQDVDTAAADVAKKNEELGQLEGRKVAATEPAAVAALDEQIAAKTAERDAAQAELERKQAERTEALEDLSVAQATNARSSAAANATAGGGIDRAPNVEIAEEIASIQKGYITDVNVDAIMAACVTELSQTSSTDSDRSLLAGHCDLLVPAFQRMLPDIIRLGGRDSEVEVIDARANADATKTAARAASARFALGRAIVDYCATKEDKDQDACVEKQAKVFGVSMVK